MTCSFHKYGEYFPGTGELRDTGVGQGKNYAVNFPLRDGITDVTYKSIFEPVIRSVMEWYRPEAVVLQCGGDSLSGDRLGCFNLSMRGHANCVNFVKSFDLPTLVLGGGGYTMRNVARTWAYETGILVGQSLGSELPYNDYYEVKTFHNFETNHANRSKYFAPDYQLDVRPSNMDNANTREYLDKIRNQVVENLKRTAFAPSVQMTDVPRNPLLDGMDDEADDIMDDLDEDENKDKRFTQRRFDQRTEKEGELSDSEDEDENAANGVRRQPGAVRRRNQVNYRNLEPDSGLDSGLATPQDASSAAEGDMDFALDAKMADVPRTEPDAPSTAPDASHADETPKTDADQMVVEKEEQKDSSNSRLQSPPSRDEDTTMEDVAAVTESTASEQVPAPEVTAENNSAVDGSTTSPARASSPPKELPVTANEKIAEASPPAAGIETPTTKEESLEHAVEPKKEE